MLTNWCNYKCPYCFGMDQMAPKKKAQAMSDETFLGILGWLDKTHYRNPIHLMGGEPTLHPKFEWIVDTLLERDFPITVFSNMASDKMPVYAEKLAMLPIFWIANINYSSSSLTEEQRERIEGVLHTLGKNVSLNINIMPEGDDEDWPVELIVKHQLARSIKVGFALPTYTQVNRSLEGDEYRVVAEKTVRLAQKAEKYGIKLEYECGIPTCSFTPLQLGTLWKCGSMLQSSCCSRMDVTPDGRLIYCLPMSTVASRPYTDFETYDEAKNWFETQFAPYRRLGRTFRCATCTLMDAAHCNGGCLAKNLIGVQNIKIEK